MARKLGMCETCGNETCRPRYRMCLPCERATRITRKGTVEDYKADWIKQKKYGIEPGEFETWFLVFKGRCGICNRQVSIGGTKAINRASLDHNHKTGKIRGI